MLIASRREWQCHRHVSQALVIESRNLSTTFPTKARSSSIFPSSSSSFRSETLNMADSITGSRGRLETYLTKASSRTNSPTDRLNRRIERCEARAEQKHNRWSDNSAEYPSEPGGPRCHRGKELCNET